MQPTHSTHKHKHSALKRKPIKRHQHCVLSCVLSSCCVCPWVCVCVWQRGKVINILFYSNWLAMISQNWLDIPIASDEYIFYSLFTHRMNWEITSVSHCNRFNSHRSHFRVCVCSTQRLSVFYCRLVGRAYTFDTRLSLTPFSFVLLHCCSIPPHWRVVCATLSQTQTVGQTDGQFDHRSLFAFNNFTTFVIWLDIEFHSGFRHWGYSIIILIGMLRQSYWFWDCVLEAPIWSTYCI